MTDSFRTLASGGDPVVAAAKRAAKDAQRADLQEEFDRSLTELIERRQEARYGPGTPLRFVYATETAVKGRVGQEA